MLINKRIAICTDKVLLVPYCRHHVTTYHDWMQDPVATASEPLSVAEEYAMQESWRNDSDKLTFILCHPPFESPCLPDNVIEIASMIGDVNMFLSVHEEEDQTLSLVAEVELMIAVKEFRRRGLGRSAVLIFLFYVLQHEAEIVQQHPESNEVSLDAKHIDYFVVKINEENCRSLSLFEALGFEKTAKVPNFFGEFELRRYDLSMDVVKSLLSQHDIRGYQEVQYQNDKNQDQE